MDKRYGRLLGVWFLLLLLTGCASTMMVAGMSAELMGGKNAIKNPFIEADLDVLFIDEISAMIKLNQLVLERMPISYEDPWPELLNDYRKKARSQIEIQKKDAYNACLRKLLRKDFSFYNFYNLQAYLAYITVSSKDVITGLLGTAGSSAFIKAAEELGKEYEHAKLVLEYIPFGCKCAYFRPEYTDITPKSRVCTHMKINPQCDFFNKPTDIMLVYYLYKKGGIKAWADLQVPVVCFRVVSGEQLGTFKEVFSSLLPGNIRYQIEHVDEELVDTKAELETIKAKLKDKNLPKEERMALIKKKKELSRQVQNKKVIQDKLYKEAIQTIEVTPENIKKAKKLLEIVKFIDHNFTNTATAMSVLTLKIIQDAQRIPKMNVQQGLISFAVLSKKGVFTKKSKNIYKQRFELLAKRIVALPINYFEIWGHAIAQKYQVAKYKTYLQAMIQMEEKLAKKNKL